LAHHLLLSTVVALLAVKAIIWAVALGSGTSGGVLAPLLMIGAGLGYLIGPWLPGGDPRLWALVCMAATLGGTMRAPLMAILFAFELTGNSHALLPLTLGCATAYGFSVLVMPRSILTEKIARRGLHVYREYGVDPLERSFVDEVMTRDVVAIPADMPIERARQTFFGAHQAHRGYPVVDGETLVGLIRRDDFKDATEGHVRDLLHGVGPVALLGETCRSVAARMAATGVERLPVIDAQGSHALVGIVSRSDLLDPARDTHEDEMPRERFFGGSGA
jgi:CBS domain-containing protein